MKLGCFLFIFFSQLAVAQDLSSDTVTSGLIQVNQPNAVTSLHVTTESLGVQELKGQVARAAEAGANVIVTTSSSQVYSGLEKLNKNKLMLFLTKAKEQVSQKVLQPIEQDKTQFVILTMITGYEIYMWFADSSINSTAAFGQTFLSLVWYFSFGLDKQSWVRLRSGVADYIFSKTSSIFTSHNFKNYLNFLTNLGLIATWVSFRMGVFGVTGNSDFFMGKGDFTSLQILAKAGLISSLVAIAHSLSNVFIDNWYKEMKSRFDTKTASGQELNNDERLQKRSLDRIIEFKTFHLGMVLTAAGLVNPDMNGYSAWGWTVAYAMSGSLIYYYRNHLDHVLSYDIGKKISTTLSNLKEKYHRSGVISCSALFN